MVRETLRSRIVRFTRRWRLRAGVAAGSLLGLWLLVALFRSPPPPSVPAPPPPPTPATMLRPDPVVAPLPEKRRLMAECVRRRELKAPAAEIEEIDRKLETHLGTLPPGEVLELVSEGAPGVVLPILLRAADNGLASDRPLWEKAFLDALGRVSGDPARREGMAGLLFTRVRDESLRGSAALSLATSPEGGGVLALAAREAPAAARPALRRVLWGRVDDPGAVDALGEILEPAEADRLASLGPRPDVRRALQAARERTGDAAFQGALDRLR